MDCDGILQALWSYTSDEILFDRRFVSTISHHQGRWQVDFSKLSLTSSSSKERDNGGSSSRLDSETSDL